MWLLSFCKLSNMLSRPSLMYAAVCDYFMKNVGKIKGFQLDFLFVYLFIFYLFIYLFPQKASGAACPTCKPLHTSMGEI